MHTTSEFEYANGNLCLKDSQVKMFHAYGPWKFTLKKKHKEDTRLNWIRWHNVQVTNVVSKCMTLFNNCTLAYLFHQSMLFFK